MLSVNDNERLTRVGPGTPMGSLMRRYWQPVLLTREVADPDGESRLWALEATGRTGLERIGINRDYVKVGDTIQARCHVLRDGTNGCLLGFLKAPDGSVKDWDGGRAEAPADF